MFELSDSMEAHLAIAQNNEEMAEKYANIKGLNQMAWTEKGNLNCNDYG